MNEWSKALGEITSLKMLDFIGMSSGIERVDDWTLDQEENSTVRCPHDKRQRVYGTKGHSRMKQ